MATVYVILLTLFLITDGLIDLPDSEDYENILYVIGDDDESYTELEQDLDIINMGIDAGGNGSFYTDNEIAGQSMEMRVDNEPGAVAVGAVYDIDSNDMQYYHDEID